jgi:hypothetical protein
MFGRQSLKRTAGLALLLCAACTATAASAVAGTPTGDFARFNQCPRFAEVSLPYEAGYCIYVKTFGGEVTVGRRVVPVARPIALVGGFMRHENMEREFDSEPVFLAALNGETLPRSPQPVPGGLFGMPLYVTLELIPPASDIELNVENLFNDHGSVAVLPVRLHLENQLLGSECYVGSRTQPIVLHLTAARTNPSPPNPPISGEVGKVIFRDEYGLVEVLSNVLVDNTFAVPGADGCGGPGRGSLVDAMVDGALDLPSPGGHNAIVEDNDIWDGSALSVIASESG